MVDLLLMITFIHVAMPLFLFICLIILYFMWINFFPHWFFSYLLEFLHLYVFLNLRNCVIITASIFLDVFMYSFFFPFGIWLAKMWNLLYSSIVPWGMLAFSLCSVCFCPYPFLLFPIFLPILSFSVLFLYGISKYL